MAGTIIEGKYKNGCKFRASERKGTSTKQLHSGYHYGRTRREAQDKLNAWIRAGGFDALAAAARDKSLPEPLQTVGEYVKNWYAVHAKARYAPTTAETNSHRLPYILDDAKLAGTPLGELKKADVRAWLARLDTTENNKAKVLQLLGQALRQAVDDEMIASNPADILDKPKKSRSEIEAFTPDETRKIIDYANGRECAALVRVLLDAGLRQSEAFGLQWKCVDFAVGSIRIERTVVSLEGGRRGELRETTKTDHSRRTIRLAPKTLAALQALKANSKSEFVFVPQNGSAHHPHWFRGIFATYWSAILEGAGVDHKGAHTTRHTCATELLRAGAYLTAVSKRLGHSSPNVTLATYSSVIPSDDAKLVEMTAALF